MAHVNVLSDDPAFRKPLLRALPARRHRQWRAEKCRQQFSS
jgi:hypothetical protein